jgi:hypothetical protein
MDLLDPRFRYVPAAATDITATWRRFGFDSRRNEERRARVRQRLAQETRDGFGDTPATLALVTARTRRSSSG